MKVTKGDVDKAEAAAKAASKAAAAKAASKAAAYAADYAAWDKYFKLKEEFENGSN